MYREALQFLEKWQLQKKRKPLIIRGARQVGKSTLVRQFAHLKKIKLLEINLEKNRYLDEHFKKLDLTLILNELEALVGESLHNSDALLFLDEIQATPHALPLLRYFYEEYPKMMIIAAGSLLEFVLDDHQFSMPVGRIEYFHLGPMNFKEFLHALEEHHLIGLMEKFQPNSSFPESAHRKLVKRQREFLFVGGMPEAVLEFKESSSLKEVSRVQKSINSTYYDDFSKYMRDKKDLARLQNIFRYIPSHIGQKIKYSTISKEDTSKNLKTALNLLSKAGVITSIFYSSCSGIPLKAQADFDIYKCIFLDCGLMNQALSLDWLALSSLDERNLINEGGLAEQFIGQHLLYRKKGLEEPELHYWIKEAKSKNAEIDYVISQGNWIIPVEVKAGLSGTLRSMHQFYFFKKPPLMIRFDLNLPSLKKYSHPVKIGNSIEEISYKMLSLPLYMVDEVERILFEIRESLA